MKDGMEKGRMGENRGSKRTGQKKRGNVQEKADCVRGLKQE